jgi:hypothetical protein
VPQRAGLTTDRLQNALLVVAVALFPFVLACCLAWPLFTDEITFKVVHARYFLDDHQFINITPQCQAAFYRHPWPIFLPFRFLDALLYGDMSSPFRLRAISVASFALWVALVGWARNRMTRRRRFAVEGFRETFPWLTLGVAPFLLSLSRPEQPMTWCLSFAVLAPLVGTRLKPNVLLALWALAALAGFSYHFTMVPFAPLWIVSAFLLWKETWRRAVACGAVALSTIATLSFAVTGNTCPESSRTDVLVNSNVLNPGTFLKNPGGFVLQALHDLVGTGRYLEHVLFQQIYMNWWLPSPAVPLGPLEQALNACVVLAVLGALGFVGWSLVRRLRERGKSRSSALGGAALAAALLLGVTGLAATQISKVFYHDLLILPVLMLACLAAAQPLKPGSTSARRAGYAQLALLALSCVSQTVLLSTFAGKALGDWQKPGTAPGQPFSVNHLGYAETAETVRALAVRCAISPGPETRRLVLDDTTYPALYRTREPVFLWYLFFWAGEHDIPKFMRSFGSDGLIADCSHLERSDRERALRSGDFCCLPKPSPAP